MKKKLMTAAGALLAVAAMLLAGGAGHWRMR